MPKNSTVHRDARKVKNGSLVQLRERKVVLFFWPRDVIYYQNVSYKVSNVQVTLKKSHLSLLRQSAINLNKVGESIRRITVDD